MPLGDTDVPEVEDELNYDPLDHQNVWADPPELSELLPEQSLDDEIEADLGADV